MTVEEQVVEMLSNLDFESLEFEDVQCHICFQVNHEPVTFLTCKHSICAGCAGRWLSSCSVCPMCRTRVREIHLNDDLKKKSLEFLKLHPEQELPEDIKWEQCCHETVFWSLQQRKRANESDAVFYGSQPVVPEHLSAEESNDFIETKRLENIRIRLDVLTKQVAEQTPRVQQYYNVEKFNQLFYQNEISYRDEDQEWRMVHGRGLIRIPRSTNRHYCPLRFRRSHSS